MIDQIRTVISFVCMIAWVEASGVEWDIGQTPGMVSARLSVLDNQATVQLCNDRDQAE